MSRACKHENGVLLHHHLGNTATVGELRGELERSPESFPVILTKVIYNGVHAGDFLDASQIARLKTEIPALRELRGNTTEMEQLLRHFESQIVELVECAQRNSKPISF